MAVDVLLGVYLAERRRADPTTFKELCWDLRYSEQAIRTIVDRLGGAGWVVLEHDRRFRRPIARLRIPPDKAAILEQGLELLREALHGRIDAGI
jgi:DNA-binding MarR family transcriptional regulator